MTTTFGPRIRALREASALSLRDVSDRSGVSAPMLSQVERGDTSPTVAVAARIADGLGLSLSQLLRLDEEPRIAVVSKSQRRRTKRGVHSYEELTPSLPGQRATVSVHTLRPGGSTGRPDDPPIHEPGSRETAVVQSGTIVLELGDEEHRLRSGDAVTFDADLRHRFTNPTDTDAEFLAVVTTGMADRGRSQ